MASGRVGLGRAGATIAVMGRSAACGEARVSALEAEERLGPVNVLVNAPGVNSSTHSLILAWTNGTGSSTRTLTPSLLPKSSH